MDLDSLTAFGLVAYPVLLLLAGPITRLVDRVTARVRRRGGASAGAAATPYRTKEAAPVDAWRDENRRLRLALAATRLVAVGPLFVIAGAAWVAARGLPWEPTPDAGALAAEAAARAHRHHGPALPFDSRSNRVAPLGRLDYTGGADGFQVPIEFRFGAPLGAPIEATLDLEVRARVIPGQTPMTEGIWVDGVLSGTTWPGFRVSDATVEDISGRNEAFTRAVFACCTETRGHVRLSLAELLQGSMVTPESALSDGVLQVVVADDVEVYAATLLLCGALSQEYPPRCTDATGRPVDAVSLPSTLQARRRAIDWSRQGR